MCASGAAFRKECIKGVVNTKSPKCIRNVTNIFLPLRSIIAFLHIINNIFTPRLLYAIINSKLKLTKEVS